MARFLRRAVLVVLFCAAGSFVCQINAADIESGVSIPWVSLGKPPALPTGILRINSGVWVAAADGAIYEHDDQAGCSGNCWKKTDSVPGAPQDERPLDQCNHPRQTMDFSSYQAACEWYGPGGFYVTYYGIARDGSVYRWEQGSAEGDAINAAIAPFMGGCLGLGCAALLVIALYAFDSHRSSGAAGA